MTGGHPTTLYELFDVDHRATAEEIRVAYIRLMKRYHPDVSALPYGELPSARAAELNAAFAILRDRRRRDEYDAQVPGAVVSQTGVTGDVFIQRLRRRPPRVALPLVISMAGLIGLFLFSRMLALSNAEPPIAEIARAEAHVTPDVGIRLNSNELRKTIDYAMGMPADRAVLASQSCFGNARRMPRLEAAASCVIFDDALLLWTSRKGYEASETPYFDLEQVRQRHLGALRSWNQDNDQVLRWLRSVALNSLVNRISREAVEPPSADLVARAKASWSSRTGISVDPK